MGSVCVCMLDLLKLIRAAQLLTTSQILISTIFWPMGAVSVWCTCSEKGSRPPFAVKSA